MKVPFMLERKTRCPNNQPHRPSVHCAGACSKTWPRGALREETQRDYIRFVRSFAAFVGRPPDTATAEDLRRFQVHQVESGVQPPTINCSVSALRFFFTVTIDRPDLSRRLVLARHPRKLPLVLSAEEVGRLHGA
jgi:integrase/recombinase XerD